MESKRRRDAWSRTKLKFIFTHCMEKEEKRCVEQK
jgi:hypothetical protein